MFRESKQPWMKNHTRKWVNRKLANQFKHWFKTPEEIIVKLEDGEPLWKSGS